MNMSKAQEATALKQSMKVIGRLHSFCADGRGTKEERLLIAASLPVLEKAATHADIDTLYETFVGLAVEGIRLN